MTAEYDPVNLFKDEGEEYRSVDLYVDLNGSLRMETCDMGPKVEEIQGDFDFEFWVDVPSSSQTRLLVALLRQRYGGRPKAVTEFRDFCKLNDIEHHEGYWR